MPILTRRRFLKSSAAATLTILPYSVYGVSPSDKFNTAHIGVGGMGRADLRLISRYPNVNVVALCDVDERQMAGGAKKFPKAKTYVDWRKCLEQKDLDAVVCCTADHTHAHITNWAINRGLHVYCEKPLALTAAEALGHNEFVLTKLYRSA